MQATGNPSFRSGTRKAGTVGVPVFDTEISIRPLGGGDPLPPGERGEVCIRGPQVMRGYAHRPEATAESIDADGWFHSGDVGILDEDGYLSIVDRTKDMLLYKGYNVFPRELEEILFGVPGVAGAAVVGRPDEEAGELPIAYVVRTGDDAGAALTAESVMAAVNDKVTPYKRLRDVVFIDAIPVSAAGKVLKRELAAREREKVGSPARRLTRTGAAARSRARPLTTVRGVESGHVGTETEHTGVRLAHEEESPVRQVWRRVVFAVPRPRVHGGRHLPRPGRLPGRRRRRAVPARLHLLRDRHALDHRLRRHHPDHADRAAGQHPADHAAAHHVPARPHRNDPRGAHRALAGGVPASDAGGPACASTSSSAATAPRAAARSAPCRPTATPLDKIVVVDPEPRAIDEANSLGLTGIVGDAGRTEVLRRASVERARAVIVAANRDDAAVLITLTVRQLNPSVPITTSVREEENANLLRQSGADTVITTSATSGRLLGLSTDAPRVVAVVEDLVTGGQGLDLHQRTGHLQRGRARAPLDCATSCCR